MIKFHAHELHADSTLTELFLAVAALRSAQSPFVRSITRVPRRTVGQTSAPPPDQTYRSVGKENTWN